jgi:hypothetical protein
VLQVSCAAEPTLTAFSLAVEVLPGPVLETRLSHSPTEVSRRARAQVIRPDLLLGGDSIWFGAVADVAPLPNGVFAVLDHARRHVQVFDSLGHPMATIGRPGEGPGEISEPWALTSVGSTLVVRQNVPGRVFTVFDLDGRLATTARAEPAGDWHRPVFRQPSLTYDGLQMGTEDVSRRLIAFDSTSYIHVLHPDEFADPDWSAPAQFSALPAFLIRYDLDGIPLDTIAILAGPPTIVESVEVGRTIFYAQPLFASRPVWAVGDEWLATGHGDSTSVVVESISGDPLLSVTWPRSRITISQTDREDGAKWSMAGSILRQPSASERIDADPSLLDRELELRTTETMSFAETAPQIMSAFGAGACLFLAGHAPSDWQDGTSLTWLAIHVHTGALLGVLRLEPPADPSIPWEGYGQHGAAVRAFDERNAYASYRDGSGVPMVARYPLPFRCTG